MILFLPVSTYVVLYEVVTSRPYGPLEQLILRAVQTKQCETLDQLKKTFCLHERLLMEALVSLFYSGHLGFSSNQRLVYLLGAKAVDSGQSSETAATEFAEVRTTHQKAANLIQERITGQIQRRDAVRYVRLHDLKKDPKFQDGFPIPPEGLLSTIDPGQVAGLLPVPPGGYLGEIKAVQLDRNGQDVLVVPVNHQTREVHGLPAAWHAALLDPLLLWAEHFAKGRAPNDPRLATNDAKRSSSKDPEQTDAVPWVRVSRQNLVLLSGTLAPMKALHELLASARSQVVLFSPGLCDEQIAALDHPLREAVQRGVNIDILWGSPPEPAAAASHRSAMERLKRIEYDSRARSTGARLFVGRAPSGVRSALCIGDPDEQLQIILGTHDLLGFSPKATDLALSVNVRACVQATTLFRVLADVCADDEALQPSGVTSWLRYQAIEMNRVAAAKKSATTDDSIELRFLIDRQHEAGLQDAVNDATARFDLGTEWLTASGLHGRMQKPTRVLERGTVQVTVHYADLDLSAVQQGLLAEQIEKPGGALAHAPSLCTNFLIQDADRAVVTCHRWLDQYPRAQRTFGMEIGVDLRGTGIGTAARQGLGLAG